MEKECIVITNPMIAANKSTQVTLSKFLRVISVAYERITVIGGNISLDSDLTQINVISIPIRRGANKLRRLLDMCLLQLRMSRSVAKHTKKKIPVYFWTGDKMLLPYWVARWKKGDVRYFLYGNVTKEGSPSRFRQLSGSLISYMANHANSVCVESPGVLEQWKETVKARKTRIIHLYTQPVVQSGSRQPEKVIGMLCRLTEGKHVLDSIKAFVKFHETHPDYRLEIIGSGKQEEACKAAITQCSAQEYISLLGWVEHQMVTEKTARWMYLLFPTDTEGMPNSVIEMMAMGIPAIASPVGGIPDIIDHGRNGWLLSGTGEEEIRGALCAAVTCVKNYPSMSRLAQEEITHQFCLKNAQATACKNI